MILLPQTLLPIFLLSVPFFWYFTKASQRVTVLIVTSIVVIWILSIYALLIVVCGVVFTWLLSFAVVRLKNRLFLALSVVIVVLPLAVLEFVRIFKVGNVSLLTLGLAFCTLRQAAYIIDVYYERVRPTWSGLFFVNIFFPTFLSGPLETTRSLPTSFLAVPFSLPDFCYGLTRVALGCLKIYFLYSQILPDLMTWLTPAKGIPMARLTAYAIIMLKWVTLYVGFSGYADIAIGTARLYGVKVRENFNCPFLAGNIQNFWQRWHMSLMNYVFEYVFRPFVRSFGRPELGLLVTYLIIGLWHSFSLGYLIWGLAHAAAMIMHRRWRIYSEDKVVIRNFRETAVWKAASVLITLSYVAIISYLATANTIGKGWAVVLSIFRL